MNVYKRAKTFVRTVRLYKSWPLLIRSSLPGFRMAEPTVCVLRNGISYEVASWSDLHVIKEIWTHAHYGRLLPEIRESSVVIDIGAHIGVFSIMAARRAPGVRVFAFEPLPENFLRFTKNIARNVLAGQITAVQQAVGGTRGTRDLYMMPERFSPSLHPLAGSEGKVSVACVTLADIFDAHGIATCDFLKIDCEGAEYEILMSTPPEYFKRIRSITLETHDHLGLALQGDVHSLAAFLKNLNFEVAISEDPAHLLFARNLSM